MRTILNQNEKQEFLANNWEYRTITFKYSRCYVCRLYDCRDRQTKFHAGGGGYDKKGSVLGQWILANFKDSLKKIVKKRTKFGSTFYGLSFYNKKTKKRQMKYTKNCSISIDGACGFRSMETILNIMNILK